MLATRALDAKRRGEERRGEWKKGSYDSRRRNGDEERDVR
jgi:hypothetical protein